jgi:hypothetical protein
VTRLRRAEVLQDPHDFVIEGDGPWERIDVVRLVNDDGVNPGATQQRREHGTHRTHRPETNNYGIGHLGHFPLPERVAAVNELCIPMPWEQPRPAR